MCGKVCIPIDYCPKVSRLASQLGISDLILHYNEANKLPDMINRYKANEEFYKNKVKENVIFLRKEANRMFELVEKIIKER
jgi:polysaccharide pyruvyl transferase WcaK-like protein